MVRRQGSAAEMGRFMAIAMKLWSGVGGTRAE